MAQPQARPLSPSSTQPRRNAADGPLTHEVESEAPVDSKGLTEYIRKLFASPSYQPPSLPTVAIELTALAGKPNVEVDKVVKLLEQDALLSSRLLRVANSPLFAGQMPILSLKQAVVRLGLGGVRDLVLEAAMSVRVFKSTRYARPMDALRRHSLACAHLSRLVCRYSTVEGEFAFTCGLLHDVGVAAAFLAFSDQPAAGGKKESNAPSIDMLWPAVEAIHAEAAGVVLGGWKLPKEIELIATHHHKPTISGYPHPLVAVLSVAEMLAKESGLALEPQGDSGALANLEGDSESRPGMQLKQAMEVLSMTSKQHELLQTEAKSLIDSLSSAL